MERVKQLASRYYGHIVEYRRHFHQYPELSGEEKNTAAYICGILESLDIKYQYPVAGHGIVALLQGGTAEGKTVALRADMDALPIQEEGKGLSYRSRTDGVSHACGHDAHMACLLGALHILRALESEWNGTVKAIFQPSEEEYEGGAKFMIEEGVLQDPEVDVIYGLHVTPDMELGTVGTRPGGMMASTDEIRLHLIGKGGHAALPGEVVNPLDLGVDLIWKMKDFLKAQACRPPLLLTFGKFVANGTNNIVPDRAEVAGTLRAFDEKWRGIVFSELEDAAKATAEEYGGGIATDIRHGYPVLVNPEGKTRQFMKEAANYLGDHNVIEIPLRMTAEDFAYYLQEKPGVFFRLGTSNREDGITRNLHSSDFDIDERALEIGSGLLAWITLQEMKNNTK